MSTLKNIGITKPIISKLGSSTDDSSKYEWITYVVIGLLVIGIGILLYFILKKPKTNSPCTPSCDNNKCGSDDGCGGNCQTGLCTDSSNICSNGVCTPPTCDQSSPCSTKCPTGTCTDSSKTCQGGTCECDQSSPCSTKCPTGTCTDSSKTCQGGVCTTPTGDPTCESLCTKYGGDPSVKCYCGTGYSNHYCFDSKGKVCSAVTDKASCANTGMIWCTG